MESKTEKNKTFVDSVVAVLHDTTLNLSQRKDEVQKIMDEVEASKSLVKIGDFELDDIKVDSLSADGANRLRHQKRKPQVVVALWIQSVTDNRHPHQSRAWNGLLLSKGQRVL